MLGRLLHLLTSRHQLMSKDGVGEVLVCYHWLLGRRRYHTFFRTGPDEEWREVDETELNEIMRSEL
jgi:hypothetical protein